MICASMICGSKDLRVPMICGSNDLHVRLGLASS